MCINQNNSAERWGRGGATCGGREGASRAEREEHDASGAAAGHGYPPLRAGSTCAGAGQALGCMYLCMTVGG